MVMWSKTTNLSTRRILGWALAVAWPFLGAAPARAGDAPSPVEESAVVLRLARPDREAAEVLKLFRGARAASPAAALRAWKQATRLERSLGKPLEALIASFNPAMISEWRFLDEAELHLGFGAQDGAPRWFALVPHDDGTGAAALTAARLSNPDDEPLRLPNDQGQTAVARLSRSRGPLACVAGPTIVLGSSRETLETGARFALAPASAVPAPAPAPVSAPAATPSPSLPPAASGPGLEFLVLPEQIAEPPASGLTFRRVVGSLHAIRCVRAEGAVVLADGQLAMDWISTFARDGSAKPKAGLPRSEIDPAWLERIASRDALAFVSMACGPAPEFWNKAFALADRIEKIDPAYAAVAPVRTRLNALALLAGARPEVDLWPHLRGLTACLWHAPKQPRRLGGGRLALRIDTEAHAARLADQFFPRFVALLSRRIKQPTAAGNGLPVSTGSKPEASEPKRSGLVEGRPLTIERSGRDVFIVWGDAAFSPEGPGAPARDRSCAALRRDWAEPGRGLPARAGAFWPGRLMVFLDRARPGSPALDRVLEQAPPITWRGWSGDDRAVEQLRWSGLSELTRRFLETVPNGPPPLP